MTLHFPNYFTFGVADADLQVIGEMHTQKFENSPETMWHNFAKKRNIDTPAKGIDRYHRWKEDIEIMKKLGIKQYRTSVSMSRILNQNGTVNQTAIKWYQTYFKALKAAGIEIYVTLYHWELPHFLMERGGFTNLQTADWLVKHTRMVYEYLGEYIEEYFLLNEPWTTIIIGHYWGDMPPGEKNLSSALLAAHNLLIAQGLMYKELSKHPVKISTVYNVIGYYADTLDAKDILAAQTAYESVNSWFLDPLFHGAYPEYLLEVYGKSVPEYSAEDMKIIEIGDKIHALGLNYYFSETAKYSKSKEVHFETILKKGSVTNGLNWPITVPPVYSDGLYDILQQIYFAYKNFGLKKIYIAENGLAGDKTWDGKSKTIADNLRIFYYQEHLRQVHKAMHAGIPIEKYFLWTLMDNYEWSQGYNPNAAFGIIHVDRKTMQRIPKKSSEWYKKILKTNTLEIKLQKPPTVHRR
jgi:beta-glucosidase